MNKRTLIMLLISVISISCALKPQKFEANIPKEPPSYTNFAENKNPKSQIVIEVNSDGKLSIKGKDFGSIKNMNLLEKEVSRLLEINKKESDKNATTVFVKASRSVKYGEITLLVDKLKELGASPVGIQIDDN